MKNFPVISKTAAIIAAALGLGLLFQVFFGSRTQTQTVDLPSAYGTAQVQVSYPTRLLVGKTAKLRLSLTLPEGANLTGSIVFDRQLDAPGLIVRPQKRVMSPLSSNEKFAYHWNLSAINAGPSACSLQMALTDGQASGLFALTPQAVLPFEIRVYKILGMGARQARTLGLALTAAGVLLFFASRALNPPLSASRKIKS